MIGQSDNAFAADLRAVAVTQRFQIHAAVQVMLLEAADRLDGRFQNMVAGTTGPGGMQ